MRGSVESNAQAPWISGHLKRTHALILLAMSIGLVQVAGSATTLPFLGPDVHLNLRCSVPLAPRPSTLPTASVIGSHGYSS